MTACAAEPRPAITTAPPFGLDAPSLGWGVVAWCEEMLRQPDGEDAGGPFRFTGEQISFVLNFYALTAHGRFIYRRAVLRRAKGWGKSPVMAALGLAELMGPVRFGGFDAAGQPVGVPHPAPWVTLAGVSQAQTDNTMTLILAMLEGSRAAAEYDVDPGLTRVYLNGGRGRLLPATANSATLEGGRPSFAVLDEPHHWLASNGGHKLARVIRRNLAKSRDGSARSIETTNAHTPGYDSVAELSYLDHRAMAEGRTRAGGLLYDSREAPTVDLTDPEELLAGLAAAYGDSVWVDLERLREEIYDPGTPVEESRRFYLNQLCAAADSWVAPHEWDANLGPDLAPLAPGDAVTLGFDGGRTDDSSALVACRIGDGSPWLLGLWEKPEGPPGAGWEVDKTQVRDAVGHAFATFDVVAFVSDVAEWETDVDAWRDEHGEALPVKATTRHAVAYDMRAHQADTVRAVEALNRAIVERELPHNGDPRLRRHVLNARRRPNRWGISFGKESRESPKKCDALAALVLARIGRARALAGGVLTRRKKTGRLYGF